MSLNSTPSSERVHIAFFGMRNAGKSSVMNRVIVQDLSVVSPEKGTTTDPVRKSMELLPLGPVVMIDTPGLDDEGELGSLRVAKSLRELEKADAAVVVIDSCEPIPDVIVNLIMSIQNRNIPYVVCFNKIDILKNENQTLLPPELKLENAVRVSAVTGEGIDELKKRIAESVGVPENRPIVRDLFSQGSYVLLVIPLDKAAPKGRLILPQQQTIRDILDGNGRVLICNEKEIGDVVKELGVLPSLVVTDSQVFKEVAGFLSPDIPLTSFSILFARYKGNLDTAVKGVSILSKLEGGEQILISEGCTHHRQCGDIGSVKIPGWIRKYTGKDFDFQFTSGTAFPEDLSEYALVIHCGGCMLTEREMKRRYRHAEDEEIAITNYGILIAFVNGILERSLSLFPSVLSYLQR